MRRASIAVAIVSWNTETLLARCLESFESTSDSKTAEVWVVDNASEDGSVAMVRERFPWVRLIASEENLGFGRAVNLVATQTESDWVAPANADIALRPGALEALLRAGERDPGAGALAPRLILPSGDIQHSVFGFPTVFFSLVLATGVYKRSSVLGDRLAFPGRWDKSRERRVPWAVAAFILIRRSAWEEIGGFDDRQWMYAEDLDIGWRLREAGWATRYVPSAVIDHESAASTSQLFGERLEPHWQRSTYGFLARRRGLANTWTVALINALGAYLRWAKAAAMGLAGRSNTELRRAHARWGLVHLRALRSKRHLEELR